MTVTVGIDLGTTHSLCAWFHEDKPQLIPNQHGSFLTPSIVGILESNEVIVGAAAKELRVTHPDRALQSLQSAAAQSGDGDWMNVILSFIRGDVGLMLFGNAQMFVS